MMNSYSNNTNQGNDGTYRGGPSYMSHSPIRLINTYGLSASFLKSLGIHGPLVSKVFVANIDYFVESKMLEEVFQLAGKVLNVEILTQDGKSRGMALIEYSHPYEAVQAVSLFHNELYYDRRITVRMDRNAEKEFNKFEEIPLPVGLKTIGMGLGINGAPQRDISNLPNTLIPISSIPWNRQSGNSVSPLYQGSNDPMSDMGNMHREINGIGSNMSMRNTVDMGQVGDSMNRMGYNHHNQMGMYSSNYNNVMGNYSPFGQSGNQNGTTNGTQNQGTQPPNCVVQINNLPYDYTWQTLRDLCKAFGEVKFAEIMGRGSGRIRFAHEINARKAAESLCHRIIEGRTLDARVM